MAQIRLIKPVSLACGLAAAILIIVVCAASAQETSAPDDRIRQLEAMVKLLERTIERQKATIAELQATIAELRTQLAKAAAEAPPAVEKADKADDSPADEESASPVKVTPAAKGVWAGFRGIAWGTDISTLEGMLLMGDSDESRDTKRYRRKGDKLAIGGAELKEIIYEFYKGRFLCVAIFAEGQANWTALKAAIFARYGVGSQTSQFIKSWYWFGERTGVGMSLGLNEITDETTVYMIYQPLNAEKTADEARAAKEAGKDF